VKCRNVYQVFISQTRVYARVGTQFKEIVKNSARVSSYQLSADVRMEEWQGEFNFSA